MVACHVIVNQAHFGLQTTTIMPIIGVSRKIRQLCEITLICFLKMVLYKDGVHPQEQKSAVYGISVDGHSKQKPL